MNPGLGRRWRHDKCECQRKREAPGSHSAGGEAINFHAALFVLYGELRNGCTGHENHFSAHGFPQGRGVDDESAKGPAIATPRRLKHGSQGRLANIHSLGKTIY